MRSGYPYYSQTMFGFWCSCRLWLKKQTFQFLIFYQLTNNYTFYIVLAMYLLTPKEASALLKVCIHTLRNWGRRGVIKEYRVGPKKLRRYLREDVLALLAEREPKDNG